MPSPRRRPTPQPGRKPQVAGLRRPGGGKPSPRPRPTPYSAQHEDRFAEEQLTDGTQAPAEPPEVYDEPELTQAPVDEDVEDTVVEGSVAEVEPDAEEAAPEAVTAEPEAAPRRTPRSKARDTGTARPTSVEDVEVTPVEEPAPAAAGGGGRRNNTPLWIAVALAVVFVAAAALAGWQYFVASGEAENRAQSDPISSSQAGDEIVSAVQTLFSYDYTKLDGRDDEVEALLASDKLRKQFATLNCAVKDQAPKQKIVTATRVSYRAITELTDTTAKAIVFVENVWERKSTKQQEASAGSLGVSAELVGDRWKLTELKVHGGEAGKEPPVPAKCK